MREKDFQELLIATGNKPTTIEKILRELLTGEFRNLKQKSVKLHIRKIKNKMRALAVVQSDDIRIDIFLDSDYLDNIKFFDGKNEDTVRQLLRHEFLHIQTGLSDNDQDFWQICLKKKIPVSI
jgi:hypothetical protein